MERLLNSSLALRMISGVILIPLVLGLIYLGFPYSAVFGVVVALGVLSEWIVLCSKNKLSWGKKILCVVGGNIYFGLSLCFFFQLLALNAWEFLYTLLIIVWSTDTAAYAGGKLLGGPKLIPSISPNKTWSGFGCGMTGGTIIGYLSASWLVPNLFSIPLVASLVFIGQIGDLLESQVKRWSGVKDSGFLIPGHGGFLDRLDSLMALLFVTFFLFGFTVFL